MSSFLRRQRHDQTRDEIVLPHVVALAHPASDGPVPDCPVPEGDGGRISDDTAPASRATADCYDLHVTDQGLIIGAVPEACAPVPALVPWPEVCSVHGVGAAELADGSCGEILEIEVTDGGWIGDHRVQRFVAQTTALEPFVAAATSHRPVTLDSDLKEPGQHAGRLTMVRTAVVAVLAGAWTWVAAAPAGVRTTVMSVLAWARSWVMAVLATLQSLVSRRTGLTFHRAFHKKGGEPQGSNPQHGLGRRRIGPIAIGAMAIILLTGSTGTPFGSAAGGATNPRDGNGAGNGAQSLQEGRGVHLAAATTKPKPAPPSLAKSPPLQSHEIFGYAPYWTLPLSSGFDVKDLTTLAYFSVDANPNGTLDESGPGWNGYESQDLVNLVNRSHAAGDRVVLTVTDFSQSSLNAITSDPNAGARLSAALVSAVAAKNLDGVNFDFEGEGSGDQRGLTRLITQVSKALHAANPHWQVTMAVYASSASDSGGFYNIAALAPAVDGFFVMAYEMNNSQVSSATAPLVGGGYTPTESLQQFTAVVSPQKVILGVPFYGYDWPTSSGTLTAHATGGNTPLSDAVIASSGHPTYWDPATDSSWTSYKVGTQWHETFFDNPTSLALRARVANSFHIAGLGIWALGMDGNNPAMMAALLGNAPAVKDYQTGPTTLTTTAAPGSPTTSTPGPPGANYVTTGVWKGSAVSLTAIVTPASEGTPQYLGTLSQLTTNDPALACLETGTPLSVWSFSTLPGVDVVVASQPQDCAAATWTFPTTTKSAKTSGGSKSTTTTTTQPKRTTTTTTDPPTTTTTDPPTTTTTDPPTTTTTDPPTTTTTDPPTTTTTDPPTTTTTAAAASPASSIGP
ncbi:MAG: glycosyl hydrolase family 18 protein [Acidimicrobiales bacterium]